MELKIYLMEFIVGKNGKIAGRMMIGKKLLKETVKTLLDKALNFYPNFVTNFSNNFILQSD